MNIVAFCLALVCSFYCLAASLIGGHIDSKKEYSEVVYVSNYYSACSATLVGPKVMLTAAHCAGDGTYLRITDPAGVKGVQGQCFHAPTNRGVVFDFAVCLLDRSIKASFAEIADQGPEVDDDVVLTGYGCTASDRSGGNNGTLKMGMAKVVATPTVKNPVFVTLGHPGNGDESALCSGDSGGPAFAQGTPHKLIGVNSKGDLHKYSVLAAVYLSHSQDFLKDFAAKHHVEICGINKDC